MIRIRHIKHGAQRLKMWKNRSIEGWTIFPAERETLISDIGSLRDDQCPDIENFIPWTDRQGPDNHTSYFSLLLFDAGANWNNEEITYKQQKQIRPWTDLPKTNNFRIVSRWGSSSSQNSKEKHSVNGADIGGVLGRDRISVVQRHCVAGGAARFFMEPLFGCKCAIFKNKNQDIYSLSIFKNKCKS